MQKYRNRILQFKRLKMLFGSLVVTRLQVYMVFLLVCWNVGWMFFTLMSMLLSIYLMIIVLFQVFNSSFITIMGQGYHVCDIHIWWRFSIERVVVRGNRWLWRLMIMLRQCIGMVCIVGWINGLVICPTRLSWVWKKRRIPITPWLFLVLDLIIATTWSTIWNFCNKCGF